MKRKKVHTQSQTQRVVWLTSKMPLWCVETKIINFSKRCFIYQKYMKRPWLAFCPSPKWRNKEKSNWEEVSNSPWKCSVNERKPNFSCCSRQCLLILGTLAEFTRLQVCFSWTELWSHRVASYVLSLVNSARQFLKWIDLLTRAAWEICVYIYPLKTYARMHAHIQ